MWKCVPPGPLYPVCTQKAGLGFVHTVMKPVLAPLACPVDGDEVPLPELTAIALARPGR